MKLAAATLAATLLAAAPALAAGFQWASAPDPDDKALELAIWYPSQGTPTEVPFGPFTLTVAFNGPVSGQNLPLIVLSHGTGGSPLNYFDTAAALADAGFVVAAVTHTGDSYKDHAYAFTRHNFADRPRQISRVIDYMLGAWPQHGALDPARIGMLGHSAGGATALLSLGGTLDWAKVVEYCRQHPEDWGCQQAVKRTGGQPDDTTAPITGADPRVKAAAVAAPALISAFAPNGLANLKVPVQVWIASQDAVVTDAALIPSLLPGSPEVHLVKGGGHFAFLAPCSEALAALAAEICQNPPGFDRAAFLRDFHTGVIAFFKKNLMAKP